MAETVVDLLRGFDKGMVLRAATLKGQCDFLAALPARPGLFSEVERELAVSSIHASAAIAGNPMPLDEVRIEMQRDPKGPEAPSGPTVARAKREIANLMLAYEPLPIGRTKESVFGVSEGFVKKVHAVLAQGTGGGPLGDYAPQQDPERTRTQTQNEMLKLITWVNTPESTSDTPLVRAALFHYGLMRLAPFALANGRVARFFETSVLTVAGVRFINLMMPGYYLHHVDEYLAFFHEGTTHNGGDFLEFFLNGVEQNLARVQGMIVEPLRTLALADYFVTLRDRREVKTRLFEFLNLLLDHEAPFQLKDLFLRQPFKLLYDKVSEHTARRDLKKLMALDLLHKEDVFYTFNRNVL